jgi:hypothetical protein
MAKPENTPDKPAVQQKETETAQISPEVQAELDEEEQEFRAIRRDLPGVKGVSAAGIVAIGVGKIPPKNEFFRTHKGFRPIVPMVDCEIGMEKQYFAVTSDMVEPLNAIGISVTDHTLYLTITSRGALRIIPVRGANTEGEQNEYHRTKEIGLIQGMDEWVRLFTDQENRCYQAFRDKGRLLDSTEHPLFKKWAARDSKNAA